MACGGHRCDRSGWTLPRLRQAIAPPCSVRAWRRYREDVPRPHELLIVKPAQPRHRAWIMKCAAQRRCPSAIACAPTTLYAPIIVD
jgi:hypothetical protein